MIPEGTCPCADGGIEEDIALELFAHIAFEADDALGIFVALVASLGTGGREEVGNAIELKESEVALILGQVFSGSLKGGIIIRVREHHSALVCPIVTAIVSACTIASHRSEPSTHTGPHLLGKGRHVAHFVRESVVEGPCAVVVPSVINDEAVRGHSVTVVEVGLPVVHHVQHLVGVHVLRGVGRIVAVDVEFIPRNIYGVSAPRHCTFAFGIGEEGAALLCALDIRLSLVAILCKESYHARNLPGLAGSQCGIAAPESLHGHHVGVHGCAFCHGIHIEGKRARGIDGFGGILHHYTYGERTVVGSIEDKAVVALGIAGVSGMVIAGSHIAGSLEEVGTTEIQTMVATGVLHGDFHLLAFFQYDILHLVGQHIGISGSGSLGNTSGHFGRGKLLPRGSGEI